MTQKGQAGPRAIALIGPYQSGKTTLLESILTLTGKTKHTPGDMKRVFGDTSAEAKAQEMGTDPNIAHCQFMGDTFFFIDLTGSIEFFQETISVLGGVDAAIVVAERELAKVRALAPMLKILDQQNVPHMLFFNKIDKLATSVRELAGMLKGISDHSVALRHLPIRDSSVAASIISKLRPGACTS